MIVHKKMTWLCICCYHYTYVHRYELQKAVTCAIALVKEGRQQRYSYLKENIYIMVELVLLLIDKVFTVDDKEVTSLMETEWSLNTFVRELIIAFTHGTKFGSYQSEHKKEIQVREYIIFICLLTYD